MARRDLPDTTTGRAVAALVAQLRVRRAQVRTNRTQDRATNVAQLAARIRDLERLTLTLAGLVAASIDPTDGDLTDDGA